MSARRSLPQSPNLEQLKKQAKDVLQAYRAGDPDAVEEFGAHPRSVTAPEAKLTDAQLVLSRSYEYDSWPELRREVARRQLRAALWEKDSQTVRDVLAEEPSVARDRFPHPMWGGQPSSLQLAAERGDTEIIRMLLDGGADPGDVGEYGWTALQLAAHWGHDEVAALLRERGTEVDIFSACLLGDAEAVASILQNDPDAATRLGLDGAPPLHFATTTSVAKLLLNHDAALTSRDSYGNTPLGSAIARQGKRCRPLAEFLLGQDPEADACQLAALGCHDELRHMIENDPDVVDYVGKIGVHGVEGTPLHAAMRYGEVEVVRMLISHGADVNRKASAGQTPLHLCRRAEIAQLLVEAATDPAATDDEHGTTPLAWARVAVDIGGASPDTADLIAYLEQVTPNA